VSSPFGKDAFVNAFELTRSDLYENIDLIMDWYETLEKVLFLDFFPRSDSIILRYSLLSSEKDQPLRIRLEPLGHACYDKVSFTDVANFMYEFTVLAVIEDENRKKSLNFYEETDPEDFFPKLDDSGVGLPSVFLQNAFKNYDKNITHM